MTGGDEMDEFSIVAVTNSGVRYTLDEPESFELKSDVETPEDTFEGVFLCRGEQLPELRYLEVYWNGELIFDGLVDEQVYSVSGSELSVALSCRNVAALLLDNEAIPAVYVQPTLYQLFQAHARPYGINGIDSNYTANFDYTISRGMSEWDVISNFCRIFTGLTPKIDRNGYLITNTLPEGQMHFVSNDPARDDIRYISYESRTCLANAVSSVLCRYSEESGYSETVTDDFAVYRGVKVRKLLDLADVPAQLHDYYIRSAFGEWGERLTHLTLHLPGIHYFPHGDSLMLSDYKSDYYDAFTIYSMSLQYGPSGFVSVYSGY